MENSLVNQGVNFVEKNMVVENDDRKIKICNSILQIMYKYIQIVRKSCEAGGILIGRENSGNSNLIIEYVTEPMASDKRSRCRFSIKDILNFLKKYMRKIQKYMVILASGIRIQKIFHIIHL